MYDPFKSSKPLRGLAMEIISAESALNMNPEPIPLKDGEEEDRYLSQSDAWAKHSVEHLRKAFQCQQEVHDKLARIYLELLRLGRDNPELDKLARRLGEIEDF